MEQAVSATEKKAQVLNQADPAPEDPPEEVMGERLELVREVAYFKAESRGFEPGHEMEDWLEAETGVDRMAGG